MRAFFKLTQVQVKLYLRDPLGVFFTLLFAPILLLMIGVVSGNAPEPMFGGRGALDHSIAAYAGVIIGLVGLTAVPISASTRRENGVLRRFAVTPLRPLVYFLADIISPLVVTLLGIVLLFILGRLVFNVRFEGNVLIFAAAIILSALTFFSIGYTIAGLAPSARSATVIGNLVVIPTLFFSGAYMPLEMMPEKVQAAARFLPLYHVVSLLRGLWFGEAWRAHLGETLILAIILAAGVLVVALTFRWE